MQDAQDNAWDEAIAAIPDRPDSLGDIQLYYDDTNLSAWKNAGKKKSGIAGWLQGGAACACGAGVSHGLCVAIPALASATGGGIFGGVLASGAAMYVLSPAFALAANAGIDRLRQVKRTAKSTIFGAAATVTVALGLSFAINAATGHEHLDHSRLSDPSQEFLAAERELYDNMPETLRQEVAAAAQGMGLSPADYVAICTGADDLGERIAQFRREYWGKPQAELTLEP